MNKKRLGIISGIVVLLAVAVGVMTLNDKGLGLQVEEISANGISEIEVVSQHDSIIVRQGETDKITLSLMSNYKNSSKLSYSVENGKLVVNAIYQPSYFNLSLNMDRLKNEPLQITIPASAEISTLTIQSKDADEITVGPVNAGKVNVTSNDSDIRIIAMEGIVDAQTRFGKITSTVALSAEIEKNSNDSYTYGGQIGSSNNNNGSITLSSNSGNIIFE